jgi:hypothetical protein
VNKNPNFLLIAQMHIKLCSVIVQNYVYWAIPFKLQREVGFETPF